MSEIDWERLRAAATEVMRHAYVPYSKFPVGAAALVDDGRVVVGCNVENAAYGVVLCAECGVVSSLHATGGGRIVALSCVDATGEPLMPCGRCRQLLWEQAGRNVSSRPGAGRCGWPNCCRTPSTWPTSRRSPGSGRCRWYPTGWLPGADGAPSSCTRTSPPVSRSGRPTGNARPETTRARDRGAGGGPELGRPGGGDRLGAGAYAPGGGGRRVRHDLLGR